MTTASLPPVMLGQTTAGPVVSPRNALAISDVLACVRVLADTAATLPLKAYRRRPDGSRERITGGTADLLRRPAPGVTQAAFVGQLMTHLLLWGSAFVALYSNAEGGIEQLGLVPPDAVSVEVIGGEPLYTLTSADGRRQTVGVNDLVHVRANLSVDGITGISPIGQAREAVGLSRALAEQASATAANGNRIGGVLTVPAGPSEDDDMKSLRAAFEARHSGTAAAGRIAVLTSDVQFQATTMPLDDAQFVEQRRMSTQEIARLYGVPPWMVGADAGSSLTYSNTTDQARSYITFGARGWLVAVEQALTACERLFPLAQDSYCAFDLDALLAGDPTQRAAVYALGLDPVQGWLRRDEVRAMEDLGPEAAPAPVEVAA